MSIAFLSFIPLYKPMYICALMFNVENMGGFKFSSLNTFVEYWRSVQALLTTSHCFLPRELLL